MEKQTKQASVHFSVPQPGTRALYEVKRDKSLTHQYVDGSICLRVNSETTFQHQGKGSATPSIAAHHKTPGNVGLPDIVSRDSLKPITFSQSLLSAMGLPWP